MDEVRVAAPAKINLCLCVGPVRPDGYHPLATVYQAIGLYDEVVLRRSTGRSVTVTGQPGTGPTGVPSGPGNLAWRALDVLGAHHRTRLEAAIEIRKRIPVAGGLAGGSADAAAALVGADALFQLRTPLPELVQLATRLGSDVPFCLLGGTALGTGRGELVTPVDIRGDYWWVVLTDPAGLPTPAVYAEFDRLTAGRPVSAPEIPEELLAALAAGDPKRLGAALVNDLQPAALSFRPELGRLIDAGLEASAHGALVTGSGPTVVLACGSAEHAEHVDRTLQREHGTDPAVIASGHVRGARVVGAAA